MHRRSKSGKRKKQSPPKHAHTHTHTHTHIHTLKTRGLVQRHASGSSAMKPTKYLALDMRHKEFAFLRLTGKESLLVTHYQCCWDWPTFDQLSRCSVSMGSDSNFLFWITTQHVNNTICTAKSHRRNSWKLVGAALYQTTSLAQNGTPVLSHLYLTPHTRCIRWHPQWCWDTGQSATKRKKCVHPTFPPEFMSLPHNFLKPLWFPPPPPNKWLNWNTASYSCLWHVEMLHGLALQTSASVGKWEKCSVLS